jgi:hypothetical protein
LDRFKAEMPQIPGVSSPGASRRTANRPKLWMAGAALGVFIVCFFAIRALTRPKRVEAPPPPPPAQLEVPSPAVDPDSLLPHATETNPSVATVAEMAKPWSSKEFFYKKRLTGENVPAILVRIPVGSASQASGYWAFAKTAAYGDCQLEYIRDLKKLGADYDFHGATHPMVGNPCNRTLFDPLKMANLPGNIWVRGAIAQGSDLRPPLGMEVEIKGKDVLVTQME